MVQVYFSDVVFLGAATFSLPSAELRCSTSRRTVDTRKPLTCSGTGLALHCCRLNGIVADRGVRRRDVVRIPVERMVVDDAMVLSCRYCKLLCCSLYTRAASREDVILVDENEIRLGF